MVPLLIGASWLLVVSLVLGLCAVARDGDLQQDPSRSAAVKQPMRPARGTIIRDKQTSTGHRAWSGRSLTRCSLAPRPGTGIRRPGADEPSPWTGGGAQPCASFGSRPSRIVKVARSGT
jgi:hypothetical protein